ncbi:hypothetical protein CSUI_001528 [Cystoisospora suis]|uniref:Transmembrane protein n=1 Tax=Cystoisospora suis TaxID=483139 RepID=A0A2C6LC41_9APIC|nr:hypothetical protein CSUI_001528 [Cystoisospora suis]
MKCTLKRRKKDNSSSLVHSHGWPLIVLFLLEIALDFLKIGMSFDGWGRRTRKEHEKTFLHAHQHTFLRRSSSLLLSFQERTCSFSCFLLLSFLLLFSLFFTFELILACTYRPVGEVEEKDVAIEIDTEMFWPLRGAASGGSGREQTHERRFSSFSSSSFSSSAPSALNRSHLFSSSPLSLSPLSLSRLSSPGLHTIPSCLSSGTSTGFLRPPSASLLVSSSSPSPFTAERDEGKGDAVLSWTLRTTPATSREGASMRRSCVSSAREERKYRERRKVVRGEDGEKIKKRKKEKRKKGCPPLEEERESFNQVVLGSSGGMGGGGGIESHLLGSHGVLFPLRYQHHVHSQSSPSLLSFKPASYSSPTPSPSSEEATRRVLGEPQISASKGSQEDTSLSISSGTEDSEKKKKKTGGNRDISERPDEKAVSSCQEETWGLVEDHRLEPLMLQRRSISEGEVESLHGDDDEVSRPRAISLVSGVHTESTTSFLVSETSSSSSSRLFSSLPVHSNRIMTTQQVEGDLSPSSLLARFVNSSPCSTDERGSSIRLYPPSYVFHLNAGGEKLLSPSSTWRHSFGSSVSTSSSSSSDFPYTSSSVPSSPNATPSSGKSVRTCRRRVSSILSSHMDLSAASTTTTTHRRRSSSSSSISSSASCSTSSPLLSYSSASTNYSFSSSVSSRRLTHPASLPSHLDELKGKTPSMGIEKKRQDLHACRSEPCQFFEAVQRSGDESGRGGVQTLRGGVQEEGLLEERGDEGESSFWKLYLVRGEGEVEQEGEKISDKEDDEEEDEEDTDSDETTSEESEEEEDEEDVLVERRLTSIEARLFIPPCLRERSASSILKERRKLSDGCCLSPLCTLSSFIPPCSSEIRHHQHRLSSSSTLTFLRRRRSRVEGGREDFPGQDRQMVELTTKQKTDDGSKHYEKQEILDGQDNKVASVHTLRRYGSEGFLPALLGVSRFFQASSRFVGDGFRTSEDRQREREDVNVVGFGPFKSDLRNPLGFFSRFKRSHQTGNGTGKKEENKEEKRQETEEKEHSSTDNALWLSFRPNESPMHAMRETKGDTQQVLEQEDELSKRGEFPGRLFRMIDKTEKEKYNTKEDDKRSIQAGEREQQGLNRSNTFLSLHTTSGIFLRREGERMGRRFSSIESIARVSNAHSICNAEEGASSSGSSSSQFYWSLSLLRRVRKMEHATLVLP